MQTRYYDPELGRFITIDDLQYLDPEHINGLNLYAYCANNPVMNVDPTGEFVITLSALLIAMGIGAAAGLIAGGVYGRLTAAANGQNVGWGIFIGALAGAFMGAGAGAADLFIAPVLAGSAVVVCTTTLSVGAALGIGTGIALLSGFIGGMGSDLWLQKVNGQSINFGTAALTGVQGRS